MMGANNPPPDPKAEAALLVTMSDPAMYAAKLKELDGRVAHVAALQQQMEQERQTVEGIKTQAEVTNAATMEMLRLINAKEADLAAREVKLIETATGVENAAIGLTRDQEAFKDKIYSFNTDKEQWMLDFEQQKADHFSEMAQVKASLEETHNIRMAELEAVHRAKLANVERLRAEAENYLEQARQTNEAANQSKASYEAKLAALKQAIG